MKKIRIEFTIEKDNPYDEEMLMRILNDISNFYPDYTCRVIKEGD